MIENRPPATSWCLDTAALSCIHQPSNQERGPCQSIQKEDLQVQPALLRHPASVDGLHRTYKGTGRTPSQRFPYLAHPSQEGTVYCTIFVIRFKQDTNHASNM